MSKYTPLCLVLMPFGKKKDANGRVMDFDAVYQRLVLPAVQAAGLQPVRPDEQQADAVPHRYLFERLLLCDYAVFDVTTGDANVAYQLGVRHAAQPHSTVLLYAEGGAQLPFHLDQLQAIPYRLSPRGLPVQEVKYRAVLSERLKKPHGVQIDSPVHRLLPDHPRSEQEEKERVREELQKTAALKERISEARGLGGDAVRAVERALGSIAEADPGVVLDLFFAYHHVRWWDEMIGLVPRMAPELADSVLVQEQLAMALNWAGRGEEAEQVLRELIARRGPSSESYGLLGRVLKHRREMALEKGETAQAKEHLAKAAGAYFKGFEADWRDTYCGVNTVTMMELKTPADPRRRGILPVVHYAVEQRIRTGAADYWDYATLLELAVLSCDEARGVEALGHSLARVRDSWEAEATARNLRLIREARQRRSAECPPWADRAEAELLKAAARGTARP